ncbi:tripartite tricarboxylate transporter TctB family protein [uncultured Phascolarctobacterium sp.]|uniref:tripartite tricarboxylate transporter TctB family protein n=1 Tax=uncultured Phascolarctobacterium sp. TaxID=512296 RepID=UPI0026012B7E|nr:tripartite tricarboxylate transporter TctB family protein [uncultured Phascolarctobacterium sp.]
MKTVDQDMVSGIGLIVLGIAGLIGASGLKNLVVADLSAAFFPNILFGILIFCGICLLYQSKKRIEKVKLPAFNYVRLGAMLAVLSIYVYIMDYIGFLIATVLFLVAAMYIFGERRKLILAGVSIAASVIVYFLFTEAFMIVLPVLNI